MTENSDDQITIELDEDLIELLQDEANKRGISIDELLNEILEAIIAEDALKAQEAGQL